MTIDVVLSLYWRYLNNSLHSGLPSPSLGKYQMRIDQTAASFTVWVLEMEDLIHYFIPNILNFFK